MRVATDRCFSNTVEANEDRQGNSSDMEADRGVIDEGVCWVGVGARGTTHPKDEGQKK